ncbi:NOL1/NOP2/sun family protein [Histomonas meleagridis]|uniref:NOL1/NOP2/sun family protein n=1 Tax=Histomonas meleagridis TaxID=135588 RepID=UPI0035597351|nr:NOL1/NOP2/sun family protein [Histomonas meleagridis]KAH0806064.1 NOL1/NOP2/sun family protein [Histomonas meleagridis]
MLHFQSTFRPQFFRISPKVEEYPVLIDELKKNIELLNEEQIDASILEYIDPSLGTFARVFVPQRVFQKNPQIEPYRDWLVKNQENNTVLRAEFTEFLPCLFLPIQPTDNVLIINQKEGVSTQFILDQISSGVIVSNITDIKKQRNKINGDTSKLVTISYPPEKIPEFPSKFDKILCNPPNTRDGALHNSPGQESSWKIDNSIPMHQIQKKTLIRSLQLLNVGGYCVYTTDSFSPYENEAVINTVLKSLDGAVEIVDCTEVYPEIDRKQGLTKWKTDVFDDDPNQETEASISPAELVDGINNCMRFYPQQIYDNGIFIAVLKKNNDFAYDPLNEEVDVKDQYTVTDVSIIDNYINFFGLNEEIRTMNFLSQETLNIANVFYISDNLLQFLNGLDISKLKICFIGQKAFSYAVKYPEEAPIPSVETIPAAMRNPSKRVLTLSLNGFKAIVASQNRIEIQHLSEGIIRDMSNMQTGGIYIEIEGYGIITGALWKAPYIRLLNKKNITEKEVRIVEAALSSK